MWIVIVGNFYRAFFFDTQPEADAFVEEHEYKPGRWAGYSFTVMQATRPA